MSEKYNGWTNYPTWNINLWLGDDQEMINELANSARSAANSNDPASIAYELASMIKDHVTDLFEEMGLPDNGPASDIMGWALVMVDWSELASNWLESADLGMPDAPYNCFFCDDYFDDHSSGGWDTENDFVCHVCAKKQDHNIRYNW